MEWVATLSVEVENVAWPLPLRAPLPRSVAPSLKLTVPSGVPAAKVTVAVKVTD